MLDIIEPDPTFASAVCRVLAEKEDARPSSGMALDEHAGGGASRHTLQNSMS
jgi:hypothetical protein